MCPSIIQYFLLIIGYLSIASGLVVKVVKDLGKGSKNKMEIFNGICHYASDPPLMALISIHFYPIFFYFAIEYY